MEKQLTRKDFKVGQQIKTWNGSIVTIVNIAKAGKYKPLVTKTENGTMQYFDFSQVELLNA